MPVPLDVLILEDHPPDTELMLAALRRAGFDPRSQCVDSRDSFLAGLDPPPELILSDYSMPQFNAVDALNLLKDRGLMIPFIVVSGSIGEDQAVAAIKLGADDYLLKDRMGRLGNAVKQALELKRLRHEKEKIERSHSRLAAIIEATTDFVSIADAKGRLLYVNRAGRRMLDISEREDVSDLSVKDFHPAWALQIVQDQGLPGAREKGA
ncbi:MAG: response regulator, partial [Nitrospirae bacterium]|nr:response regulator [Nitrospirota bacterium]